MMNGARSIYFVLLEKGWRVPGKEDNILAGLLHKQAGIYRILPAIGPKSSYGATYFRLFLQNEAGEISREAVLAGLYNQGVYPAYNWFEISFLARHVAFGTDDATRACLTDELSLKILRYLADMIPPGGHMMMGYDEDFHQTTAYLLANGVPPVSTALGYLLYSLGLTAGFKDWYFAEGGLEGPRKLQAYKELDRDHGKIKAKEMMAELNAFLRGPPLDAGGEAEKTARDRAKSILEELAEYV
jgi:hypothetical protein